MTTGRKSLLAPEYQFVRVRFTRRVPTIHLGWHVPFDGEKRLTTLCGQTALTTMDDSPERLCATCERMARVPDMPDQLPVCRWCGKRRNPSGWEQKILGSDDYASLCASCARRRLHNPWNALLALRKVAA